MTAKLPSESSISLVPEVGFVTSNAIQKTILSATPFAPRFELFDKLNAPEMVIDEDEDEAEPSESPPQLVNKPSSL